MMDEHDIKELIKESLEEFFFSEEDYGPFNGLHDKMNQLIEVSRIEDRAQIGLKTCDKVDDYMRNVDKLNAMINEFKGLVAIARSQVKQNQDASETLALQLKEICGIFRLYMMERAP
jgi:hypothetical protein